jgi:hypothetical protein
MEDKPEYKKCIKENEKGNINKKGKIMFPANA